MTDDDHTEDPMPRPLGARPIADYATVAEFADQLSMDVQTVRRQIANGRIESYQPGTSWPLLIPRSEINRYRLASRRGSKPTTE